MSGRHICVDPMTHHPFVFASVKVGLLSDHLLSSSMNRAARGLRAEPTALPVFQALAGACDMFTGAELAGLCREAAITALREDLQVGKQMLLLF